MAKGNVKIVLNRDGVKALLKSAEMEVECKRHAEQIRSRCGVGYETSTYQGKTRVNASVGATSKEAMRDCLKNNTLLKAMGGS